MPVPASSTWRLSQTAGATGRTSICRRCKMLADMADVTVSQILGSLEAWQAWILQYRLHHAFSIVTADTSAVSRNRSHARRARSGFLVSGWASGPYTHTIVRVLDTHWYRVPEAVARLLFWIEVVLGSAPRLTHHTPGICPCLAWTGPLLS